MSQMKALMRYKKWYLMKYSGSLHVLKTILKTPVRRGPRLTHQTGLGRNPVRGTPKPVVVSKASRAVIYCTYAMFERQKK